ncbi:MAG: A24 family peptidase [Nocardioides sp.]|nr:A24 family peptidase [Nocardioides sp.]
MDWGAHVATAAACAVVGALGGWLVPRLVVRLPEPALTQGQAQPPKPPKPLYADLAKTPGLAPKSAAWAALAAGLIGLGTGWSWSLLFLIPLVPIGVALGFVDFKARLLPTRLIAPSYLLVIAGVLVVTVLTGDLTVLRWAAIGWACAGGLFWFLWRFTRGMGYGDVRLSGGLGLALGHLGWGELLVGLYAAFVLGAVGWIPLRLLKITTDRKVPFGPFMLLGAVVGILWGADVAGYLAGYLAGGQG